jgi:hypothetical protein
MSWMALVGGVSTGAEPCTGAARKPLSALVRANSQTPTAPAADFFDGIDPKLAGKAPKVGYYPRSRKPSENLSPVSTTPKRST